METRAHWIVAVDCPKHVNGIWDHFQGQQLFLEEDEWKQFSWSNDFNNAKQFESLKEAKEFAGGISRSDMSDGTIKRGSEYYMVFGLSEAIHMVKFIKVLMHFEVREFPETDFQTPSDQEIRAETDPEFAEFLRLQQKFKR